MVTAQPPSSMTAAERLDEVAAILAAGMRRLHQKMQVVNSAAAQRNSFTPTGHQSGHGARETRSRRKTS